MSKASARWTGTKTGFEVDSGSGHRVFVDQGPPFGDDAGIHPTEMLVAALATCTGVNAVLLLKKFQQPFTSLSVEVEGEQEPDWPKRFTRLHLTFAIAWDGERDQALVDKALDQACNRYCPVHATLTHGTKIEVSQREIGL